MSTRTSALDDYIGIEYNKCKALIRRNPDFEATICSIKEILGVLGHELSGQLVISAYIDGLSDYFVVPQADWADLLPRINRLSVHKNAGKQLEPQNQSSLPGRDRSPSILVISDSDNDSDSGLVPNRSCNLPAASVKDEDATGPSIGSKAQRRSREQSENNQDNESQNTARPSHTKTDEKHPDDSSQADRWGGPPRGHIVFRKRYGQPIIRPAKWSFSRYGIINQSTEGRAVGDVHFSPKPGPRADGYNHWVLEVKLGESEWVLYQEGDAHPSFWEYTLLHCNGRRPPGWITGVSMKLRRWRMKEKLG
ncbi:transmembrane protein [Ceratobasidium sp. AG-Ba]|nr:transmembrane protein [Ceratobasidium sp. AG-Ba]